MKRHKRGSSSGGVPSGQQQTQQPLRVFASGPNRACRGSPEQLFMIPLANPREVFCKATLVEAEEKAEFSRSSGPKDMVSRYKEEEKIYSRSTPGATLIDNDYDNTQLNGVSGNNWDLTDEERICVSCGQAVSDSDSNGSSVVLCQQPCGHVMCLSCVNEVINREVQWHVFTEWERPAWVSFHCPSCNGLVSVDVASGAAGLPFTPATKKGKVSPEKELFDTWTDLLGKENGLEVMLSQTCRAAAREVFLGSKLTERTEKMIAECRKILDGIKDTVMSTIVSMNGSQDELDDMDGKCLAMTAPSQKLAKAKEITISILATLKFLLGENSIDISEAHKDKNSRSLMDRVCVVYKILSSISVESLFQASVDAAITANAARAKKAEQKKQPQQQKLGKPQPNHEDTKCADENLCIYSDDDDDAGVLVPSYDDDDNDNEEDNGMVSGGTGSNLCTGESRLSFRGVVFPSSLGKTLSKVEKAISSVKESREPLHQKNRKKTQHKS